ncbi:SbcC/MukB-like Walker B domain-containing protein [Cecembia lonarensis]|uniref:Nuclease sbcCD subunit C n=1 Tax=Cecembia lonarensis (strain CCUG 58316 / KCTC 22772 / LW9) TaxID=1225176 RepID=K1LKR9_CECL9|nr:SMC family ATPase [Cecembia lonarensis]EKB50988.1 Nuclease sbcCD subunit C [Cecembia lonarensis LW9]
MIPLRLDIEGLYSYKEKQSIDFTQLTAAGLFGIFGAVGSGKSSILEAILLALYGSTERLSDRGEKNSMLNLQSEALLISFEFRSGKNNTQTYLARYSAKRNPKNFEDVKPAEHTFYKKSGEQLEPISERAEEILGMKKEHFKQTVIIPQGKFREFIDLTPGPRAEMMKELFGLERFDLSAKTGSLLKITKEEKIRLETQLQGLEDIQEELLKSKENLLEATQKEILRQKNALDAAEALFKKQELLQEKHQAWKNYQAEWEKLETKRPEIENKKSEWKDFLKAKTYLKPVWEQLKDQQAEAEKNKVSIIDCSRFKESYEKEIEADEKELQDLKEKASQKSAREAKIRDLQKVIEIKLLETQRETLEKRKETLEPAVNTRKNSIQQLQQEIQSLEQKLENMEVPNHNLLAEWKSAAKDWQQEEDLIRKKQEDLSEVKQKTALLEDKRKGLKAILPLDFTDFEAAIEATKKQKQDLETEKEMLQEKAGLAAHVHLLQEGEACPLCGSPEHPAPLQGEKESALLIAKQEEIKKLQQNLEQLERQSQQFRELGIHLDNFLQQQKKLEDELEESENKLDFLKRQLTLQGIPSKDALAEKISESDSVFRKKEEGLLQLKHVRAKWEKERLHLEEEENKLRLAEQELIAIQSKALSKKEEINDPAFCQPFYTKEARTIHETIQKVETDIQTTADKLEGKLKVLEETRHKAATNLANLKTYEQNLEANLNKIKELEIQFEKLKVEHGFPDQEALIALFHHSLDADKVDAEIRQFEDRSLVVKTKIQELESMEGLQTFSEEAFRKVTEALEECKAAYSESQKTQALLAQEIRTVQSQLKEKKELQGLFAQVENRESNLKELERLFKGSGFVKYVSSIYLKELCHTANVRFMKLTKNSLSLDIDDNNTFWVIDYLNGGKKRLLKTLSGGQTFQASLCLALALAEKVKALNQADQSFFFLDEGFGALDKNALRVVFETLKSLRHENRIVGIISHVEELQQEIGVYAKVELDAERGSLVGYSF